MLGVTWLLRFAMKQIICARFALIVAVLLMGAGPVHSQGYPSKSLRLIVPFPPGGGGDMMARTIGPALAEKLGQPVVVENRPGAGTMVAAEHVAKSPADGHMLLIAYPSLVISPALYRVARIDPLAEFRGIGRVMTMTMGMAVHPSLPVKTLRELVALARARPGEIAYGAGAGTGHYIIGEMLRRSSKIDVTPVPYQGSTQMYPALLGGHISMIVTNVVEMAPHAAVGKLRPIVVTTARRDEVLPQVPTMRESGFPDLEFDAWGGIVVRAATPDAAVSKLKDVLVSVLADASIQKRLKLQSMYVAPSSPEEFNALLRSEHARYGRAIREANIRLD